MNVVPLPNAVDIPAMLRAAADRTLEAVGAMALAVSKDLVNT